MRFHDTPPKPSRKRVKNAFEKNPIFGQMTQAILKGRECAVSFLPEDGEALGLKAPERAAVDSLRRWLAEQGLEGKFNPRKYHQSNGLWVVSVKPVARRKRERIDQPTAKSA